MIPSELSGKVRYAQGDRHGGRTYGRHEAAAILSAVDLPLALPHDPADWPVAAAMLQFNPTTPSGLTVREAGPDYWHRQLRQIAREGFNSVEIPSAWLPIGEMTSAERAALRQVCADLRLGICATSVVRKSIMERGREKEHLDLTLSAIDAAAEVGSPLVCLGLHLALPQSQLDPTWFWTVPFQISDDDAGAWRKAVATFRQIGAHAASVGVAISLELYEGTYLGTADGAVAFLHEIGHDNVGLNPDIGNLVRAQCEIEPWEAMAIKTLPYANYWHVKNYARSEHPERGVYLSTPCSMMSGIIDYRRALAFAIAHGFKGAILCENYGGDGLSVSAENARYVRTILERLGDPREAVRRPA
jgi:sugar phosphate isomerase/epimerase